MQWRYDYKFNKVTNFGTTQGLFISKRPVHDVKLNQIKIIIGVMWND